MELAPAAQQDSQAQPNTAPKIRKLPNGSTILTFDPNMMVIRWAACPVSLEARQDMDGGMVKVRDGATDVPHPDPKPGQTLRLIVRDNPSVVSATIKVSGLAARTRFSRSEIGVPQADLWRTLQVSFTPDNSGGASAFFKLPGFTSVTSIRVISFTYADGTTWTSPRQGQCSVRPDPFMRVADR